MADSDNATKGEMRQLERRMNGFRDAEDISMKEYIDVRFDSVDKKLVDMEEEIDRRFNANERETGLARRAMEHRLDSMNEFRDSLRDQAIQFISKNECHLRNEK